MMTRDLNNFSSSSTSELEMTKGTDYESVVISADMLHYFALVNTWGLGQGVTILGLIVNVVNIMVFVHQGLQDSVNISLLGLSVSDFGSLFCIFFVNLCWTPPILQMDLPFYPRQILYFFAWTHVVFTRVSTGITAWITFGRCLCIVAPLKIKSIVMPRRTVTFIAVIATIMVLSAMPVFYTTKIVWVFDFQRNRSILGTQKITSNAKLEQIAFWTNSILPTLFFIFITVCTIFLVKQLKKHVQWRRLTTSLQKDSSFSNRDTKVAKMVTAISIVFISCYAPGTLVFIIIPIYPEMTYAGKLKNVVIAIFSILLHLEAINATVNFFIYLSVSSKFKSTFLGLFCVYCFEAKQRQLEKIGRELKKI